MNSFKILFLFSILTIGFSSCEKGEGEGGTSTIKGKIYVINYNSDFTDINSEYYGQEEDVYIVYGDDEIYNDSFETHYDGSYRFQYLRQGTYKIFAYSKDTLAPSGKIAKEVIVTITEDDQVKELDDIVILN